MKSTNEKVEIYCFDVEKAIDWDRVGEDTGWSPVVENTEILKKLDFILPSGTLRIGEVLYEDEAGNHISHDIFYIYQYKGYEYEWILLALALNDQTSLGYGFHENHTTCLGCWGIKNYNEAKYQMIDELFYHWLSIGRFGDVEKIPSPYQDFLDSITPIDGAQ